MIDKYLKEELDTDTIENKNKNESISRDEFIAKI